MGSIEEMWTTINRIFSYENIESPVAAPKHYMNSHLFALSLFWPLIAHVYWHPFCRRNSRIWKELLHHLVNHASMHRIKEVPMESSVPETESIAINVSIFWTAQPFLFLENITIHVYSLRGRLYLNWRRRRAMFSSFANVFQVHDAVNMNKQGKVWSECFNYYILRASDISEYRALSRRCSPFRGTCSPPPLSQFFRLGVCRTIGHYSTYFVLLSWSMIFWLKPCTCFICLDLNDIWDLGKAGDIDGQKTNAHYYISVNLCISSSPGLSYIGVARVIPKRLWWRHYSPHPTPC